MRSRIDVSILFFGIVVVVTAMHANHNKPQPSAVNVTTTSTSRSVAKLHHRGTPDKPSGKTNDPLRNTTYPSVVTTKTKASKPRNVVPQSHNPLTVSMMRSTINFPSDAGGTTRKPTAVNSTAIAEPTAPLVVINGTSQEQGDIDNRFFINPRKATNQTKCPDATTVDAYGKCVPQFAD